MSERKLIEAGAECVCGDLILDRQTVGRYRNGQFILTDEGALKLLTMAEPAAAPEAAAAPARGRKKKADEPVENPLADLEASLDE